MSKPNIIWAPHPGAQTDFLSCPAWEVLLHGNRGGGKSDVLVMDYLQGVGQGYGSAYRGILFREAYTELGDIIAKTRKWVPQMFPTAKFNASDHKWTFDGGEELLLRYIRTEADYWAYHGHEYPWIAFEELTNWPLPNLYLKMMSCNRSSDPNIPRKYRANCNPSGPGHAWVKQRFIEKGPVCTVYTDEFGQTRSHIQSDLDENKALLNADPMYKEKLMAMTKDDPMLRDAWVKGSWNLIVGGFFTDLWDHNIHVLPHFTVPATWRIHRSFDWGSARPWGVTYGVECNGEQPDGAEVLGIPHFPKGTIIIINELYGWTGVPNEGDRATSQEIADRIKHMDIALLTEYGIKTYAGPADTSIYEVRDGTSIGKNMAGHGVGWTRAYKGAGSRIAGWAIIRQMLGAAKRKDPETPHLYFFEQAQNHIRTLPIMQRDEKKPEDINTDLEDHLMDSLRYLLARKLTQIKRRKVRM